MKQRFAVWAAGICLLFSTASAMAANHVVTIGGVGNAFSPSNLTIQAGDTVTFRNLSGFHNVVADDDSFRCSTNCASTTNPSGGAPSSSQWSQTITFNTAGDIGYYCTAHGGAGGIGMSGKIKVEGGAPPTFSIGSAVSGNWFNPAQSGHGFQLEKVNDTTVTAFWFTFDANGNQVWILGVGQIANNRIEMQAVKSRGGRFPPNFDPTQITNPPWGTMTFTFTSCNAGSVAWTSTDPAFTASGTLALERVTSVVGTTCP
jgi:plastocyanin